MVCIVILLGLFVRGGFSANGADFGPTTQRAPGFVPPAEQAPAAGSLAQPAVPLANVTDEQVGAAITRGVDFLLSNFDKTQLKPIDGEDGNVDHAGLNALCIDALLESWQATRDSRLKVGESYMKGLLDQLKHTSLIPSDNRPSPTVYAHAMRAAALAVNNRPEDHAVLVEDVNWLLRAQRDGAYTFDDTIGASSPGSVEVTQGTSPPQGSVVPTMGGSPTGKKLIVAAPVRTTLRMPAMTTLRVERATLKQPMMTKLRVPMASGIAHDTCVPSLRGVFLHPTLRTPSASGEARDMGAPLTRGGITRTTGTQNVPTPETAVDPVTADLPGEYGRTNPTTNPSSAGSDPLAYPWDATDSQMGLLGVWAGADAGIDIPRGYWLAVQNHWLREETEFGTWSYGSAICTPSIGPTFGGIFSLLVTHDWLGMSQRPDVVGNQPYHPGLTQALKWIASKDNSVTIKDDYTEFAGYNLFILARLGQASGYKYFGSHDWYRELAARVIPTQWPNGAFGRSPTGYDAVAQTAFTLIFLASGRHPIFMEKLSFDGPWANRPRDIANVTRFASRELERSMNWEVVPVERDWTDWRDSPVLYIASHEALKLTDADVEKLRSYIKAGGLVFTHADTGSNKFNQYIETGLAPALFPDYPVQDIPTDDPIYTIQYKLAPPLPKLRGVKEGSRWVLVHSPTDLANHWQTREEKRAKGDFELAVNLFIYANGKTEPRNRLVAAMATSQPSQ